ncbi:uncharacterized protein TRAVEDRAFT_20061 [Trametes versicolor FP-101664 SS1]|uniref:uncharacterized protein n=1 Tax=Trametes versicolor (strain FP-101664) TaxID=717944 RepID=UPI0004621A85|nr:uncharacterized protein TRAVEDRAFT_20061 [Trametes versicolor FP-101664 SS1]EIW59752.1 hypothetical protein TRAVEDRAFT_20061 [Trametes versicolor FP-101664 SS1]
MQEVSEQLPSSIGRGGVAALQAAASCCRNVSIEHVISAASMIRNCFGYSDQRLVKSACLCVIRIIVSYYRSSPENLKGSSTGILESIPKITHIFLEVGVVDMLNRILTGPVFDHKGYIENVLDKTLKTKADRASVPRQAAAALPPIIHARPSCSATRSSSAAPSVSVPAEHGRAPEPMYIDLRSFLRLAIPTIVILYAASPITLVYIRTSTELLKAGSFLSNDKLNLCLSLALHSLSCLPWIVIGALQLVESLLEKVPTEYKASFLHERVFHETSSPADTDAAAAMSISVYVISSSPYKKLTSVTMEPDTAITLRAPPEHKAEGYWRFWGCLRGAVGSCTQYDWCNSARSVSPTTPVGMALAVLTVTQTSALVHSLSDSLDKEILDLRDTLGLPSDSGTWLAVLSVRQACRERIFEHRILSELVIHRDALRTIYPLVEGETGDLFEGLSAAIVTARQHFEELENVWHTRLVDNAMKQTSTLYSITRAILPVDKVQAAFHRYDEMRVVCQHVMERCERGRKAMSEYVVELEKGWPNVLDRTCAR